MPRIFFQNEYREVECEPGESIRDAARRHGVVVDRLITWLPVLSRDGTCDGLGLCGTCQVWVKDPPAGAVNPITVRERLIHGMKGWRRLACLTRVFGDVEVWTAAGGPDRLVTHRPIETPPSPVKERAAQAPAASEGEDETSE